MSKPITRTLVQPNNLPRELWQYRQFVCWKYGDPKPNGKKPDKIPVNPHTLRNAGVNWPNTWTDIHTSVASYKANDWLAGIGFVLTKDDPYVGIDLDNCIQEGEFSPFACELLDELGSYSEISPSGNGLRMIVYCEQLPTVVKLPEIEIYSDSHWLSLTGNAINQHPIAEFDNLDWLTERYKPTKTLGAAHPDSSVLPNCGHKYTVPKNDYVIWQRLRRPKGLVDELYRGDTSRVGGDTSKAVWMLLKLLAQRTNGDKERMDRMIRQTKLDQSRWAEKRGEHTWLEARIDDAIHYVRGERAAWKPAGAK